MDIIGFGALNLDRLYSVNTLAGEDDESFVTGFNEAPGGSAANTVVGLARLGLTTGYIGKVASDREAELLLDDFKGENVSTAGIIISRTGSSGVVMGYINGTGGRALYVNPGVNDWLEFPEIDLEYAADTEYLHLTSFVGKKPFLAQKKLVETLSDLKISFDPGQIYAKKGLDALKPLITRCCVMFPSSTELKMLTGQDYQKGSKRLIRAGVEIVAVKLGRKGCYVTNGKERYMVEPYDVQVVDTTGAGDAFCAGFLFGLLTGRDLLQCGRIGNFMASRCISKIGARTGLPTFTDLSSFFLQGKLVSVS